MKKKNCLKKLVFTSGFSVAAAAAVNQFIFISATSKNALSSHDDLYYHWRLGKIFYTKEGKGTPVLLIHELNSASCDFEWKKIKRELSKNHTVYTLDLLGCGRSEKPNFTYANFLYVQLITDFVKKIIGERCDVVSSGNSSSLILMSSLYQSDLFRKMICINPEQLSDTYLSAGKKEKYLRTLIQLPVIGTLFYNAVHSKFFISRNLRRNQFYQASKLCDVDIQAFHEASHLGNVSVKYLFASLKANYVQIPVGSALQKINRPITILGGTGEPWIEQTISDYRELNPSIQSRLIPDTIHYPHMEEPEKTAAAIESIIDE